MTKIETSQTSDGVLVSISNLGEGKLKLLDAFNSCAEGKCACSEEEYKKVESMKVIEDGDGVTLELRAKPNETFDLNCVTECVTSTSEKTLND